MKHILVTGGAGYVGSHACKALAAAGYLPVTYDSLVTGHQEAVLWGPFVLGDILDKAALDDAVAQWKPVAIMHFAAFAYVGQSVMDPGKYYRNNVVGSLNLLEVMRDRAISKLVFSSTCATYGIPRQIPIREDHPQNPISPYGASKLMIERVLSDFAVAHSIQTISLRYFNAAGADLDAEIGEDHQPETHLIPLVLDAASGAKDAITILGDDYDTVDGTCVRDYVHVADLADAHVLSLRALESGGTSTAYNVGNGRGYSVREVISSARKITGREIDVRIGNRRSGDPAILVSDAARISRELGWHPTRSDLDVMLETAWRWHRKRW